MLANFMEILKSRVSQVIGTDLGALGQLSYERAVLARLRNLNLTLEEYARICLNSSREEYELMQLLLVSETWFQRDQEPIREALTFLKNKQDQVRILSAPCASGEEVITTLACGLEAGISAEHIRIDGVDLSSAAVERANSYLYGSYSFRGCEAGFMQTYFDASGNVRQLRSEYRTKVHYQCGNLLEASWMPPAVSYHLILCRNLLIYLTTDARRNVLKRLRQLLVPDGILIVTAAESPFVESSLFQACPANYSLFTPQPETLTTYFTDWNLESRSLSTKKESQRVWGKISRTFPLSSAVPSAPVARLRDAKIDVVSCQDSSIHSISMSYEQALELLEQQPHDPDLLFTLGVLTSEAGDVEGARIWFEKALIAAPGHEEAQLFISALENK